MVCVRCKVKEAETERREVDWVKGKTQVERRTKEYFVTFHFSSYIPCMVFLFDAQVKDNKLIWIPVNLDTR